jgi:hypothetical protein
MRVLWEIAMAGCLGLAPWGMVFAQQEGSQATATETGSTKATHDHVGVPVNRRPARKAARARSVSDGPRKVVVRQGGVDEPTAQIVTDMTPEEANRRRWEAEQLLASTDLTVKRVAPGPMDAPREETVSQIRNYIRGAHSALQEGDLARGHTLAVKASLLAQDLARR